MSFRVSFSSRWAVVLAAFAGVVLAAPAAASANSYNDAVLADGPLTYYQLNETSGTTAFDSSGNHVDGTYSNATLGVPAAFPGAVTAVSFNGNGSVSATLSGTVHTAELWVKPSQKNAQMSFVTHGDPAGDGWTVGIGARHKLVFKTAGRTINSRFPVAVNRWTMIDVAWTSSSVSFALNGGQSQYRTKALPVAAPGPASNTALTIGDGPLGAVKGAIDEVALYPSALTRTQIGGHINATGLPVNTALPSISGVPRVGETLSTDNGSWTGSPTMFSYDWQACDNLGNCTDIGTNSSSLLLDASDVNDTIQVIVTATNLIGPSSVTSNSTEPVVTTGPVATTAPSISGNAVEGQTLSANPGLWDDQGAPVSFSYQWSRCDADGENCSPIGGAIAQTYLLGSGDVGSTIYVTVTATDASNNQNTADSDVTDVVTAKPAGGSTTAGTAGATGGVLGAQVVCKARLASLPKRISKRQRGFGKVALRFTRGSGNTALKTVLSSRKHSVRSVEFRLDGTRVKRLRRSPFRAGISVSRLKPGATQTLKIIVTPRHGSKFSLKVRLRVAACS
jgi:hypothetical protein